MGERGIYQKYKIKRTDGSHRRGRKHEHCSYFVLDLAHDPFAITALKAYARACAKERPELAADLQNIINAEHSPHARFGPASADEMAARLMDRADTEADQP